MYVVYTTIQLETKTSTNQADSVADFFCLEVSTIFLLCVSAINENLTEKIVENRR